MKNETEIFNFESHAVRTISDNAGETWFVAKDIADILEYSDAEKMIRLLDDDDYVISQIGVSHTEKTKARKTQSMYLINESGLYSAIIYSTKPEAKRFKKWVTSEVLPSIRKQGFYADLNNTLTTLAPQQVLDNMAKLVDTLRKELPNFQITEKAVLVNKPTQNRPFYVAINKKGYAGISVANKAILFDWAHSDHYSDSELVNEIMTELQKLCRNYRSPSKWKPFSLLNTYEEIIGFKTDDEALQIAQKMQSIVVNSVDTKRLTLQ